MAKQIKVDDRVMVIAGEYAGEEGLVFATVTNTVTSNVEDVMIDFDEHDEMLKPSQLHLMS